MSDGESIILIKDPVCDTPLDDMILLLRWMNLTADFKGTKYYFCSIKCKKAFEKEPEKFCRSESS